MTTLTLVEDLEPIDPLDQDRRMKAVLVQLELLTYGATYQYAGATARQKPLGGDMPAKQWGAAADEAEPLHLHWRARYVLAAPGEREQVIVDAQDAAIRARRGPLDVPEGETAEQWERRMIKDGEGADADHVALAFNCLPRMVRKIRSRWKREPEYGRIMVPVDAGERRALVEQLVNVEGVSMRATAMRLGVNYSTVLRDLGRKAA